MFTIAVADDKKSALIQVAQIVMAYNIIIS